MKTYGPGYAVVDTETTGLRPGWNERVGEVAVVHVSPEGEVTGWWDTASLSRRPGPTPRFSNNECRDLERITALLVAADPDRLSGKARDYGIPIVTEDGLARLLDEMGGQA